MKIERPPSVAIAGPRWSLSSALQGLDSGEPTARVTLTGDAQAIFADVPLADLELLAVGILGQVRYLQNP